jgi:hypothetical protein
MKKDDPYGDGGGARVGQPDTPQRDNMGQGSLGAGKESTGGIAKEGSGKTDEARSATAPAKAAKAGKDANAIEPGTDKGSGYGGNKGDPKPSSDQR